MLKYMILILLLMELCFGSLLVSKVCDNNGDCKFEECCLQRPFTTQFYCTKRVAEGKVCWNGHHNATESSDKFRIICPCRRHLECRYMEQLQKPIFAVAKCRVKPADDTK